MFWQEGQSSTTSMKKQLHGVRVRQSQHGEQLRLQSSKDCDHHSHKYEKHKKNNALLGFLALFSPEEIYTFQIFWSISCREGGYQDDGVKQQSQQVWRSLVEERLGWIGAALAAVDGMINNMSLCFLCFLSFL